MEQNKGYSSGIDSSNYRSNSSSQFNQESKTNTLKLGDLKQSKLYG